MTGKQEGDGVHDAVAARLELVGQRYTPGRRRLVDVLADGIGPRTLPEILDASSQLAQSSAYRNLAVLEQAGAVTRVAGAGDHARYELAEDLTEHHHHLVCTTCGSVADVRLAQATEQVVERAVAEAAAGVGFDVSGHSLDVLGTCAECK